MNNNEKTPGGVRLRTAMNYLDDKWIDEALGVEAYTRGAGILSA